ncbi:MAG TPA: hypothetical protein VFM99_08880 [Chitinophagales bacterium]|nr:hypothetical protein [Chitinophagales bacterium]
MHCIPPTPGKQVKQVPVLSDIVVTSQEPSPPTHIQVIVIEFPANAFYV